MHVSDVLSAPAEFDHEIRVRAVGPAVVIVLERDAPLRLETLASTEAELRLLEAAAANDPVWNALLGVYFAHEQQEREDDHFARLAGACK